MDKQAFPPLPRLTPRLLGLGRPRHGRVLVRPWGRTLMEGRASLLPGFPANSLQAWLCVGGGIATVFVYPR